MSIFQKNSVMPTTNISFAGAGRVAGALCGRLYSKGFKIGLIVSLSQKKGRVLADSCKASWSDRLEYPEETDIIIIAVPDRNLETVLNNLVCSSETLVVHTAGSIGMNVFPEKISKSGVFYPLQTFSGERKISFSDLPFLIEASDKQCLAVLKELAESIGGKVYYADSESRILIHLAAVFINNFTNHMLAQGLEISKKAGFQFDILMPLLKETVAKAMELGPEKSQTGPAVRNDRNTIEKHLELLSFTPDLQKMYDVITKSIIRYHNKS